MLKNVFSTLALSLFFSAVCAAAPEGACYIIYQISHMPEVTKCYDRYTNQDCVNEQKRTDWELAQEYKNKSTSWISSNKWYEGLRCR